jgi:hypothetical protein
MDHSGRSSNATSTDDGIVPTTPVGSIDELCDLFVAKRGWHKARKKDFDISDFQEDSSSHYKTYGIKEDTTGFIIPPAPTIVIQQCATLKDNTFLRNPITGKVITVNTNILREQMVKRGWEVLLVDHYFDAGSLPPAITQESATSVNVEDTLPPAEPTFPSKGLMGGKLPALWKLHKDETLATTLVRAFEEKLVIKGKKDKLQVYSPFHYWTTDTFKGMDIKPGSKFNLWCVAYYAIREVIKKDPNDEEFKSLTMNELVKQGRAVKNGAVKNASNGDESWFELAKRVSGSNMNN